MKWNLPNKLTIARVILIVPFVVILLCAHAGFDWGFVTEYADFISLGIFIIASLTDMADGKIARKYGLVTNFGKFMDPLADKMLVSSAFICLVELGRIPAWIVIVIIAREFVISGFRLIASDNGIVIAASYWGKFKTTFQMFAIILLILNFGETYPMIHILEQILIYVALILTIVSLVDYVAKNLDVLKEGGPEEQ